MGGGRGAVDRRTILSKHISKTARVVIKPERHLVRTTAMFALEI